LDFRLAAHCPLGTLNRRHLLVVSSASYDYGFQLIHLPIFTRSALVVASWLALTGGLHLDGAMDTADGWMVGEPQRRLAAMQDSRAGAFGVMAAVAIALLKCAALTELTLNRFWALPMVAAWGRWGQVVAIAAYPYLKPTGKGAFHKRSLQLPQDWLLSTGTVLGWSAAHVYHAPATVWLTVASHSCGALFALGSGWIIQQRFGGQTGDTYGAIVEWTEALTLVAIATLSVH
ncbi:MAG: adenosylcobinamide-GDP ribazoletransferase, partial [Spirulinaceae cyanobacterium RM2_2_10]|nr:adenosylcobinamide-GDP ribazoletransferase [Spirulinaceae cyanobacterium RM2_2_10]